MFDVIQIDVTSYYKGAAGLRKAKQNKDILSRDVRYLDLV